VKELCLWKIDTLGELSVAASMETHLLAQGEIAMANCVYSNNVNLIILSLLSDHLGWDSFLEGRISSHCLAVVSPLLCCWGKFLLPFPWGRQFISKLHNAIPTSTIGEKVAQLHQSTMILLIRWKVVLL
jgi:hypothetical protein